ncbi:MAG: hypothetical protein QM831_08480 [Kofleriaceae bacterium]
MTRIVLALLLAGCTADSPPPTTNCAPPPAPTRDGKTLVIAKGGQVIGHLTIPRGDVGELVLEADTPDGRDLRERWHQIETGERRVSIEMHASTPEGGRGPLTTRFYTKDSDQYVTGVELWLKYGQDMVDGYDVIEKELQR